MSPHALNVALAQAEKSQPDPGNGARIVIDQFYTTIPIVTGSGGETNTLPDPPYGGCFLTLWHKTDGGGSRVITASTAINSTGNNTITLGDAGDILTLVSVPDASGFRYEVVANNGASLSTV